jgi:hypothetical protein
MATLRVHGSYGSLIIIGEKAANLYHKTSRAPKEPSGWCGAAPVSLTDAQVVHRHEPIVNTIVAKLRANVPHTNAWHRQVSVKVPHLHLRPEVST